MDIVFNKESFELRIRRVSAFDVFHSFSPSFYGFVFET
ncbi:hypothetical protein CHCC20492_1815 [Bacillus paralicheniformis]|nr:hypothetical protein CHCC20492_1815 [Bacillus paralicheniformis]